MSRAGTILEYGQETESILEHQLELICERMDPAKAKADLDKIASRGKRVYREIKVGLNTAKSQMKKDLDKSVAPYPELKGAVARDLQKGDKKAKEVAARVKSRVGKVNLKKNSAKVSEEFEQEIRNAIYEEVELESHSVMQELKIPKGTWNKIKGFLVGFIGTNILLAVNTALFMAFALVFAPPLAMIITAIVVAPITEEFFKIIAAKWLKNDVPALAFSFLEFVQYVAKILLISAMMTNPAAMVFSLLSGVIVRWWVVKMHMTTAVLYRQDVEAFGKVRKQTIIRGMGIHAVWNLIGSIQSIIGLINPALGQWVGTRVFTLIGLAGVKNVIADFIKRESGSARAGTKATPEPIFPPDPARKPTRKPALAPA